MASKPPHGENHGVKMFLATWQDPEDPNVLVQKILYMNPNGQEASHEDTQRYELQRWLKWRTVACRICDGSQTLLPKLSL